MGKGLQHSQERISHVVLLILAVAKEDVVVCLVRHPLDPQLVANVDGDCGIWRGDAAILVLDLVVDLVIGDLPEYIQRGVLVE